MLKREEHRRALVNAATSAARSSSRHRQRAACCTAEEHATGCAGCYTALSALELYAEAFDAAGALDQLEGFASFHGPAFYGLPRSTGTVTLKRERWTLPETVPFGDAPPQAGGGEQLSWRQVA